MKLLECRNAPYGANNFPFLSLRLLRSPCLALWMKARATKMVKFSFISIYSEGPIYLSLSIQSNKRKDSKNIFIHFPFLYWKSTFNEVGRDGEIIFYLEAARRICASSLSILSLCCLFPLRCYVWEAFVEMKITRWKEKFREVKSMARVCRVWSDDEKIFLWKNWNRVIK